MLDVIRFLGSFCRDRHSIGAVAPSSRGLARRMVQALGPVAADQVVVELGAGTGVFTRRLLQEHPGVSIIAFEIDRALAALMRRRFPTIRIAERCASGIGEYLAEHGFRREQVAGVISGLPMLSLPDDIRDRIFASLREVLMPGRRYVQFTYCRRAWDSFMPSGFALGRTRRVLLNLPPAVVLPFERVAA